MKKKIFSLILGLLLVFEFTGNVKADCVPSSNNSICPLSIGHNAVCDTGGLRYCCSTDVDCGKLKSGSIGVNGGSGSGGVSGSTNILCGSGDNGILTAIGCVPVLGDTTGNSFATFLLRWSIGVGGGVAFLLIVYASFMIMTSQGDPQRLKAGQELLTSAISGILLLIFSIFILNFIGINILGIFK